MKNLNQLHQKNALCQIWLNWPSDSGEENENVKSLQACRWTDSRRQAIKVPFIQGCLITSLVEIGHVILKEKFFKSNQCLITISLFHPLDISGKPLTRLHIKALDISGKPLTRLHQGIRAGIFLQLPLLLVVSFPVHINGVAVQDTSLLFTE